MRTWRCSRSLSSRRRPRWRSWSTSWNFTPTGWNAHPTSPRDSSRTRSTGLHIPKLTNSARRTSKATLWFSVQWWPTSRRSTRCSATLNSPPGCKYSKPITWKHPPASDSVTCCPTPQSSMAGTAPSCHVMNFLSTMQSSCLKATVRLWQLILTCRLPTSYARR